MFLRACFIIAKFRLEHWISSTTSKLNLSELSNEYQLQFFWCMFKVTITFYKWHFNDILKWLSVIFKSANFSKVSIFTLKNLHFQNVHWLIVETVKKANTKEKSLSFALELSSFSKHSNENVKISNDGTTSRKIFSGGISNSESVSILGVISKSRVNFNTRRHFKSRVTFNTRSHLKVQSQFQYSESF